MPRITQLISRLKIQNKTLVYVFLDSSLYKILISMKDSIKKLKVSSIVHKEVLAWELPYNHVMKKNVSKEANTQSGDHTERD